VEKAPDRTGEQDECVSALAWSPDSRILAAAVLRSSTPGGRRGGGGAEGRTEESLVLLWGFPSAKPLAELRSEDGRVRGLHFSSDGKTLTTAASDGTLRFWDVSTGREKRRAWRLGQPVVCLASSPAGEFLAAASRRSVVVWDIFTGEVRRRLAFPAPEVTAVAFAPDGRLLAGAGGRTIRLWDAVAGTVVADAPAVANPVTTVAFSTDGARLFSGHAGERVVRCWGVARLAPCPEPDGHAAPVRALAFSPDGKRLLTSTLADGFRSWDPEGGKPLPPGGGDHEDVSVTEWLGSTGRVWPSLCEHLLYGYASVDERDLLPVRRVGNLGRLPRFFTCSADGRRVLAVQKGGGGRPALVIKDSRDGKTLRAFTWEGGDEVRAALSPDGRTVAAAERDVIGFLDTESGTERRYDFAAPGRAGVVQASCVKFSADGSRVVVVGNQGTLRVVTAQGHLICEIEQGVTEPGVQGITGVAFSPDGQTLATGGAFDTLYLWEVSTGQLVRRLRGDRLLFSPENRRVAVLRDGAVRLDDLYGGQLLHECRSEGGLLGSLVFSPDGRLLAASCRDTTVLVWATPPWGRATGQRPDDRTLAALWEDLEDDGRARRGAESRTEPPGESWKRADRAMAARAYAAIGRLSAEPEQSIPLLKNRLRVGPPVDVRRLRALIAGLDHDRFAERAAADDELARLGVVAAPALREALARGPSPEARRRLQRLLGGLQQRQSSASYVRAVQVLERIGTEEARQVLTALAGAAAAPPGSRAAEEALRRTRANPGDRLESRPHRGGPHPGKRRP
jgi:WD40 repeat protein